MKKLVKKLILLFLPFIAVFILFLIFEPYDYFGLKGIDSTLYLSKPLSTIKQMQREQPKNMIFGDSRMANLNTDYIKEICGEDYSMMAYGGATLQEAIESFWYATENTKLEKVVFGLSFYSLNDNHYSDRFGTVIPAAESTFEFLTEYSYWKEAAHNFHQQTHNWICTKLGWEDKLFFIDNPSSLTQDITPPSEMQDGYRKDILEYSAYIESASVNYPYNGRYYLTELEKIIDYCNQNDIEITFVIFNSNRVIWDKVIFPYNIYGYMDHYKNFLKARANVIDMEFYNDYAKDDSNFLDGFHMTLEQKKFIAQLIFTDLESEYCEKSYVERKTN